MWISVYIILLFLYMFSSPFWSFGISLIFFSLFSDIFFFLPLFIFLPLLGFPRSLFFHLCLYFFPSLLFLPSLFFHIFFLNWLWFKLSISCFTEKELWSLLADTYVSKKILFLSKLSFIDIYISIPLKQKRFKFLFLIIFFYSLSIAVYFEIIIY